jgi:hypothetical protein
MKTLGNLADLTEMRGRVAMLAEADTARWGAMTLGQMMCHVADAYRYAVGEFVAARMKSPYPMPVKMLKWFSLKAPLPWPRGVPTVPEMNQGAGAGTKPTEFRADRAALQAALDAFTERFAANSDMEAEHPIFGAMTREDWMRWGWLHVDHHLRQFGR